MQLCSSTPAARPNSKSNMNICYNMHVATSILFFVLTKFLMQVALLLVPDNETFISSLMAKDESYDDLKVEMETLVSLLVPCLEQIHSILVNYIQVKF